MKKILLAFQHLSISEIMLITILSAAMGVFWCGYTFLYNILAPLLKPLGMDGLLTGVWLMGGVFFPYIIRKPGSALLGEGIASIVEAVVSQWGFGAIIYGIIQGVPLELFFLLLSYKKWDSLTLCSAGLIAGLFSSVTSLFLYQYYTFGVKYSMLYVFFSCVSAIIFAGFSSKILADKLALTGVLNNYKIIRDKMK